MVAHSQRFSLPTLFLFLLELLRVSSGFGRKAHLWVCEYGSYCMPSSLGDLNHNSTCSDCYVTFPLEGLFLGGLRCACHDWALHSLLHRY